MSISTSWQQAHAPASIRSDQNTAADRDQVTSDPTAADTINPPRRYFTRQRRALTDHERRQAAQQASMHLIALSKRLPTRARVGFYYDGFGELPTQPILTWCYRLGYFAYLPVVGSLGFDRQGQVDKRLRFVPVIQQRLVNVPTYTHQLGMQQNYSRTLLWAQSLDVVICPLVAADKRGNRMGMGGGFYDTTLAPIHRSGRKKPLKIGWCYDFQVVDHLEQQPWDVPLDALITPSGIRWF